MNRAEICRHIEVLGVVPVIRAPSAEEAVRAIDAVRAGGIATVEITMTVPNAIQVIRDIVARVGREVLVGAGTVLDPKTALACIDAGAEFIVSPGLSLPTIEAAHSRDKPIFPGALTPTEIMTAWAAGAEMVKVFPCSALGGAKYLKALAGPFPQIKFIPTGGVNATTAADYIAAGARALGVGSDLVDIEAIRSGDAAVVTRRARELLDIVLAARTEQAAARAAKGPDPSRS
jgi:2-dehydro-3-deoxyphosphogluconate aldolase/(4S)-4-hydroxy-2-oxoglutarate aldolase